jgi:hypothetical protein
MRRQASVVAVLLALIVSGLAAGAYAQGTQTGALRGRVLDEQGLPIPGVTVTIASPQMQGSRSGVTAEDGTFVFRQLPAGTYGVLYERAAFGAASHAADVPLGGEFEGTVTMHAAGISEEVQVVGDAPAALSAPAVGLNVRAGEIDALATSRTLQGIATLAPNLTENSPNAGQVVINGAFAFDNIFMLNGVDVNDNLFGSPQGLFIEDAIQETQVLTSGIGAEYGRFSGGVVNAITRSGGNIFRGSYRLNLTNPAWTRETPFEEAQGIEHEGKLSLTHESTLWRSTRARQALVLWRGPARRYHDRGGAPAHRCAVQPRGSEPPRRDQGHRNAQAEPHAAGGLPQQLSAADEPPDVSRVLDRPCRHSGPHDAELVRVHHLPGRREEQPAGRGAVVAP